MDTTARAVRRLVPTLVASLVVFEIMALADLVSAPHLVADPSRFTVFTAGAFAAAFILHVGGRPRLVEVAITLAIAGGIAAMDLSLGPIVVVGNALGKASLAVLAGRVILAKREGRREALVRLGAASIIPMFLIAVLPSLHLTALLHPTTYDGALYRIDAALGGQASFALSRVFLEHEAFGLVCRFVYLLLPIAVAGLVIVPDRAGAAPRASMMEAFVVAGAMGFVVYHLCPAAGPIYAFRATFPWDPPAAADVAALPATLGPLPRNCVPSLHTTWALLMLWYAIPKGRVATAFAVIWLVLTETATLGLGEHYVVDLVVAVPFAVAIDAMVHHTTPIARPERHLPITIGAALIAVWVLAIRDPEAHLAASPIAARVLAVATVVVPLALRRDLVALPESAIELENKPFVRVRGAWAIAAIVAAACLGAAVHAIVAGRWILAWMGAGAARAMVVAAVIAIGFALGALLGGARREPERALGHALIAIAAWCGLAPLVVPALRALHDAMAPRAPDVLVTIVIALAATLPASLAAGAARSIAARLLVDRGVPPSRIATVWVAAPSAGAALGALLAITTLLPSLGPALTVVATAIAPLVAALVAMRLAPAPRDIEPAPPRPREPFDLPVFEALSCAAIAAHAHLFTAFAGSTVHAITGAAIAIAVGLALGALLAERVPTGGLTRGAIALALAAHALACVLSWQGVPRYFASFEGYTIGRTFAEREAARFAIAAIALTPPAIAAAAWRAATCARAMSFGSIGAAIARVVGAALTLSVVVPRVGALRAIHAIAAAIAALAILEIAPALRRAAWTRWPVTPFAASMIVAALFAAQPARIDPALVAIGAHLTFEHRATGDVTASSERPFAITTVAQMTEPRAIERAVNGEPEREGPLLDHALLHARRRDRVIAVGLDARASIAGAEEISWADGRRFLLADRGRADLVLIAPPPPWRAGSASLLTRDAFALARGRLSPEGVIAVRIPLHHVAREDLAAILGAARSALPEVWIHARDTALTLVACAAPCPPEGGDEAEKILDPAGVTKLVARAAALFGSVAVMTDEDLRVELSAPRGLVRSAEESARANRAFLAPP